MTAISSVDVEFRREVLSLRRCKGCGREWPGHLHHCRLCPAILGERYAREIALVVPQFVRGDLPARALPVAVLAVELSGAASNLDALRAEASRTLATLADALPDHAVLGTLPDGVLVAIVAAGSLPESTAAVAMAAAPLHSRGSLERRGGIAVGLVVGSEPLQARVVSSAARLARAAQAGQTLAGYGAAHLLDREWQFGPVGVLARRAEDGVERATLFLGRKPRAPTPSALSPDDRAGSLLGRRAELAALDGELGAASAGEGRWCAVVAPAGGGKSKLLRTWLSRLDRNGVLVAGAAATPFGQAPGALAEQLLDALDAPAHPSSANPNGQALATALHASARQRPLVLLIDDLHWSDAESLVVLRSLDQRPPTRCLIVVALRTSFIPDVPWLFERARRLELPPLRHREREQLLRRLLPADDAAPVRAQLLEAETSSNPLYLEQAAAYLREAGLEAPLPRSLHEAVLRRLEHVRARIDRSSYDRPSPEELDAAERTVGEWLDRLESEDYESREQIAEYLSLLEQIDAALVIARTVAQLPVRRNRRLVAAIDRFYTATFAERAQAIERLAERDRANAASAAVRGAAKALAAVRLDDAIGYLDLASRLTQDNERARHLLALGDVLLARGLPTRAWRTYASAARETQNDPCRARCERRLGRAALAHAHAHPAACLIERALPRLPAEEEPATAACDLALARALLGGKAAVASALHELEQLTAESTPLLLRTRLRVALLSSDGDSDGEQLAHACAAALTLEGDPIADLAALIDTTLLLRHAAPALVADELLDEATFAAHRLGNAAAEVALHTSRSGQEFLAPLLLGS